MAEERKISSDPEVVKRYMQCFTLVLEEHPAVGELMMFSFCEASLAAGADAMLTTVGHPVKPEDRADLVRRMVANAMLGMVESTKVATLQNRANGSEPIPVHKL